MTQEWNSNNVSEDELQALSPDAPPAPEEISSGRKLIKINSSTLTLVMAFATALVVLYLLGLQNKPKKVSASEVQHQSEMEDRINQMLHNTNAQAGVKNLFADTSRLIDMLNNYFKVTVKNTDLQANPFEKHETEVAGPIPMQSNTPKQPVVGDDPRLRNLSEEFATLKVQTIMMGSTPAAIINDQMVTAGSTLGSFTVDEIKSDGVTLGWGDKKFNLALNNASSKGFQAGRH